MIDAINMLTRPLALDIKYAQTLSTMVKEGLELEVESHPQPHAVTFDNESVAMDQVTSGAERREVIAVVPLFGALSPHGEFGRTATTRFSRLLRQLDAAESVGTIIVHVNSPGGTVWGTEEAAAVLQSISDAGRTRTISVASPQMASAATWIGVCANEVVATPSGEVGSIGVICMYEEWSKYIEQLGVKIDIVRKPANKARFTGVEPLTDEMRDALDKEVSDSYGRFLAHMAKARGVTKSQVESLFGNGEMLKAREAREAGLIDRVATLEEVIEGIGKAGRKRGAKARRRQANENRQRLEEAELTI